VDDAYAGWTFIDLADLRDRWPGPFVGARLCGARDRSGDWSAVRGISVTRTPVGPRMLERCPALRWVLVRAHEADRVDAAACEARGIRVATAAPNARSCAEYIAAHAGAPPYLYIGAGRIARAAAALLPGPAVFVRRNTPAEEVAWAAGEAGTIIGTVPGSAGRVYGDALFSAAHAAVFVSISRPVTLDGSALLKALADRRIVRAVVDTLPAESRDALLASGRVTWTRHTAWSYAPEPDAYIAAVHAAALRLMEESPCPA
jgi:lactate dehydrogenase-like 2-hydroxyacid dehydrogenase